jgi:hypothetical protein
MQKKEPKFVSGCGNNQVTQQKTRFTIPDQQFQRLHLVQLEADGHRPICDSAAAYRIQLFQGYVHVPTAAPESQL